MPALPAIVSTVRDAGAVLDSFIAWHLAIGFERLFLFFDDPADPFIARLDDHPKVTAVANDAALKATWRELRCWDRLAPFIDREVMARQLLNCEAAIPMAADAGCDWLLHIDSDEAFLCTAGDVRAFFRSMADAGLKQAIFRNFEALPEQLEIEDYFREVTLFKVNKMRIHQPRFAPAQLELLRKARFTGGRDANFNLYNNGKAAGRIDSLLQPLDVHKFTRHDPSRLDEFTTATIDDAAIILHYPNCGLRSFRKKYRTLGAFADRWFDRNPVLPFHREARDACATGDAAAIRQFYCERVMLQPDEDVDELIENGLLARITAPADLLDTLA